MKIRFYQFAKRNKSSLITTGAYHEVDCQLKDATSVMTPVILLQTFIPFNFNYCYIPNWDRYYFISDSQSIEGMWEVALTEDLLASFKTEIGNTSANILYASGSTKDIADTRLPVLASVLRGETEASLGFTLSPTTGKIILGLTGKGSFGVYILQNRSDINQLLDGIDTWWTNTVESTIDSIKQCFFGGSAAECVKSAFEIPISFTSSSHGDLENLVLGNYPCLKSDGTTHIKGYKVFDPILDYSANVDIPWQYTDWRNVSGYTEVALYIPMIGIISLPASELKNENLGLLVDYKVNITSGDIAVLVKGKTTEGRIYATASGNCALPTAYGSTGLDTNKVTQAVVTGIGTLAIAASTLATGGASALAAAGIGGGLASTANAIMQSLGGTGDGSGGLGGGATCALDDKVHCFVISKQLSDTQAHFNPIIGKPYMGVAKVNQFTGYVQTDGFQFASNRAYSSEKDSINNLLDSGIYYE